MVELPANGSRTRSPSFVLARTMRFRRSNGFCVGCLPNFFSIGFGVGMDQTDYFVFVMVWISFNTDFPFSVNEKILFFLRVGLKFSIKPESKSSFKIALTLEIGTFNSFFKAVGVFTFVFRHTSILNRISLA